PTNQYLVTTISSGGGTDSIVVAAAPSNTISNVTALMGSDAAILSALNAARFGTLYIPPGNYHTAGYLKMPPMTVHLMQDGTLTLADTFEVSSVNWDGSWGPGTNTAFQEVSVASVVGAYGTYPLIYQTNFGNSSQFTHLQFQSLANNGSLD